MNKHNKHKIGKNGKIIIILNIQKCPCVYKMLMEMKFSKIINRKISAFVSHFLHLLTDKVNAFKF